MATEGFFGQQGISDATEFWNMIKFLIREEMALVRTSIPVKVVAVHGGGVGKPPTVDVLPLVNQTDGQGNKTDHDIVYGIPVQRNQGSTYTIINDPHVDDVGYISIADRDISAVKANDGAQSNPGSFRRHSMADGVYTGAILNPQTPTQYVHFRDDGIDIVDKNGNKIEMRSGYVRITTTVLQVTGDVIAGYGGASVTLLGHEHQDVTTGPDLSGPPEPGT